MARETRFELRGLRELETALALFPQRIGERVLEQSLMAGARVLRDGAKQRAPRGKGKAPKDGIRLHESIVARANLRTDKRPNTVYVAHRGSRRRLAHLIEYGRQAGVSDSGRRYAAMRARPYLEPTIEADGAAAIRKTAETMAKKIPNVARQLAGPFNQISKVNRRRL
ncbi:MAG: HK97 gp10 family phage protein [Pseudomonadota bacterium]